MEAQDPKQMMIWAAGHGWNYLAAANVLIRVLLTLRIFYVTLTTPPLEIYIFADVEKVLKSFT